MEAERVAKELEKKDAVLNVLCSNWTQEQCPERRAEYARQYHERLAELHQMAVDRVAEDGVAIE